MPKNYTENYQLNQWEPGDRVHHDDFNEDNRKIDAALAEQAAALAGKAEASALAGLATGQLRIETGVYWGDDKPTRKLKLPFKAKFAWIQEEENGEDNHMVLMGMNSFFYQVGRTPLMLDRGDGFYADAEDDGIVIKVDRSGSPEELARIALNRSSCGYLYFAIG